MTIDLALAVLAVVLVIALPPRVAEPPWSQLRQSPPLLTREQGKTGTLMSARTGKSLKQGSGWRSE